MKTITAAGKTYELHWNYGTVEETGKNMETKVSGGGGGGATFGGYGGNTSVRIQSHTIIHDQIFIVDEEGNEHSYQLKNMNVACRKGNKLSVIWAIKQGAKKGPYVMVYNHTTGQEFTDKSSLYSLFRRNGWLLLAAMVGCVFLGNFASFFYAGLVILPILWVVESYVGTKNFLKNVNWNDFK